MRVGLQREDCYEVAPATLVSLGRTLERGVGRGNYYWFVGAHSLSLSVFFFLAWWGGGIDSALVLRCFPFVRQSGVCLAARLLDREI